MALETMNHAPQVKFLGPPPADFGNTVQFWVYGGSISLEDAASAVLRVRYDGEESMYMLSPVESGAGMFAQLREKGAAKLLHGRIFWVADSLVIAIKVDPLIKYELEDVFIAPVVEFF